MIDQKLLQQAINVLKTLNEKHYGDASKKKPLLEDEKETTLYLQISLKKIPKCKSIKMIKVNLPHSLMKDNSEVCLITGDLDKKNHKAEIEPDVLHYKELLKKHGIDNISEIVTLRQLRTEYKPYEAKQKLLAAYDVFLADRKIAECLPKVLGRHFFKKRKFPIQITLNTPNLKQQVEKALSTKVFFLTGHGNSCNSEVAHLDMSNAEISENVTAMAKAFCDKLPGSWNNIMGIYLKTSLSKAIPVYMSFDDPNKVKLDEEKYDNSYEIDELSTCLNSYVKVYKDGNVKTVRVKRLPDTEIDECSKNRKKSKKEKKSKEGILEIETDKKNMCDMEEKDDPNIINLDEEQFDNSYKEIYKDGSVKTVRLKRLSGTEINNPNKIKITEENYDNSFVRAYEEGSVRTVHIIKGDICNEVHTETEMDESSKSRRKSKRKKQNKESLLEIEPDKKNVYNMEEKDDPNRVNLDKKKYDNSFVRGYEEGSVRIVHLIKGDVCNEVRTETEMDESSKSKRKSKRKKENKESIFEIEADEKNLCNMEEKDDPNRVNLDKKKYNSFVRAYEEGSVRTVHIIKGDVHNEVYNETEMEGIKVEETKDIAQKSSRKKIKKNILTDEDEKTVARSSLKGESKEISKKSKNTRKSVGNMLMREADENLTNADIMEKLPKEIGKPKSKRIREKSLLSNANTSITYSPVQATKKENAKENLRRSFSVKRNSKGKQKKRNTWK